jgi:hypothetical protein
MYDRERRPLGEIYLARFREQDVLAGKPVSPDTRLKHLIIKSRASNRAARPAARPRSEGGYALDGLASAVAARCRPKDSPANGTC